MEGEAQRLTPPPTCKEYLGSCSPGGLPGSLLQVRSLRPAPDLLSSGMGVGRLSAHALQEGLMQAGSGYRRLGGCHPTPWSAGETIQAPPGPLPQ